KKIVVGRDGRISGAMVRQLVAATLQAMGFEVIDLGLSTTPTVEVTGTMAKTAGGINLTASHNPKEWNALKLLNEKGEFISADEGRALLEIAKADQYVFAPINALGTIVEDNSYMEKHIEAILAHPLVDAEAIKNANFKIVVDAINSTGAIFVPALLRARSEERRVGKE